jgi:aryl-alcohol dehydrogenase-like predicted oxidoreductase
LKSRFFSSSLGSVSEIGLGCWQLGGSDWGEVSDEKAFDILQASVDAGVTLFDTADVYGAGRSEELIGRFLKGAGAGVRVITKLGRWGDPGWPGNFEPSAIRAHTEASLRRLDVDCLDLTQLHCIPTDVLRRGEVFETLRQLKSEGKIKGFGVSVESMEEANICLDHPDVESLQIIFNIFRQKPITALFERAQKQGVAIVVRLPLASGLLSGKFGPNTVFAANDHRNYNRNGEAFNVGETFAGLPYDVALEAVEQVRALVPAGLNMAQMALRWCLDHAAVTTVIPGASSAAMAAENAAVVDLSPLSPELHAALAEAYEANVASHIRGPY